MSISRRLTKLEMSHAGTCPTCGSAIPAALAAALAERQAEWAKTARESLIKYVEDIAARQKAGRQREASRADGEGGLLSAARARALRSGDVAEVEGADVRPEPVEGRSGEPEQEQGPDATEQAVARLIDEDPVLKILKARREARAEERQQRAAEKARPTVTNNEGDGE